MNEAEIIDQLLFRNEIIWNINQWWASISFAVMVAAYVGNQHLTKLSAALIISMYSLYSFAIAEEIYSAVRLVMASTQALLLLSESIELSLIGQETLNQAGNRTLGILFPIYLLALFSVTNGFIVFCYKKVRDK